MEIEFLDPSLSREAYKKVNTMDNQLNCFMYNIYFFFKMSHQKLKTSQFLTDSVPFFECLLYRRFFYSFEKKTMN